MWEIWNTGNVEEMANVCEEILLIPRISAEANLIIRTYLFLIIT